MKKALKKALFLFIMLFGINQSFAQISIESYNVTDVTCNGGNNGSIYIVTKGTQEGATISYNILGTTSISVDTNVTEFEIKGLKAGNSYSIVIQDQSNGASVSENGIVISSPQGVTFSYSSSNFCSNGINQMPSFPNNPFPGNKAWNFTSSSNGLVLDNNTGEIYLMYSKPGTYTVTNTSSLLESCLPSEFTQTIVVDSVPNADFSFASSSYCSTASNPSPILANGASAGLFSSDIGLNFVNTSTGQIDISSSLPGDYTVKNTITTSGACSSVISTSNISIEELPKAGFDYGWDTFCKDEWSEFVPTIDFDARVGTFSASPSGLVIKSSNGFINILSSQNGTYTISNIINGNGVCPTVEASREMKITSTCGVTTGIESDVYINKQVYPNPAKNQLNIRGEVKKVVIFNQFNEVLVSELNVLNISELSTGIYFVKIIYSDNSERIEKLIKE